MALTEGMKGFLGKEAPFGQVSIAQGATVTDARGLVSTITGPAYGSNVAQGTAPSQLGPGMPPVPYPLGSDPRLTQYRVGWNQPSAPGEGRVASYAVLREVASVEWLTRKAIEVRKNQIHNIKLDILAKDRKMQARANEIMKDNAEKIKSAKEFFKYPDGKSTFQNWMSAILEDHLVYDAVALEKRRNLNPEQGPKHPTEDFHLGKLISLELVDATTIKRLIDDSGRAPLAPLPFVQQYLYGVPRASFSTQEFIYARKNVRNHTPYGYSAVEQFLTMVQISLRFWAWVGAKYSDGTLPEGVGEAPANWTTQQIGELNEYWDALMAGDPRALRKLHFVPGGFKWHQFKDADFDEKFANLLIDFTAVAFDVTAQEMGFTQKGKGSSMGSGKSQGESAEELAYRRGPQPLITWIINDILNPILWEEFGADDLEWVMVDENRAAEKDHADALDKSLKDGLIGLDQAIEENGGEPIGVGRMWQVGNMILGEKDLKIIAGQDSEKDGGWIAWQSELTKAMTAAAPQPVPAGAPFGQATQAMQGNAATRSKGPHSGTGPGVPGNPNVEPEKFSNNARTMSEGGHTVTSSQDANGDTHHVIKNAELDEELRNYERKAVKRIKLGKSANVGFESDIISPEQLSDIDNRLAQAKTVEDVHDAFTKQASFTDAVNMADIVKMAQKMVEPDMLRLESLARDLRMKRIEENTERQITVHNTFDLTKGLVESVDAARRDIEQVSRDAETTIQSSTSTAKAEINTVMDEAAQKAATVADQAIKVAESAETTFKETKAALKTVEGALNDTLKSAKRQGSIAQGFADEATKSAERAAQAKLDAQRAQKSANRVATEATDLVTKAADAAEKAAKSIVPSQQLPNPEQYTIRYDSQGRMIGLKKTGE